MAGMTGDKKIVGLWRDSAEIQEADSAAPEEAAAPETALRPISRRPPNANGSIYRRSTEAEDRRGAARVSLARPYCPALLIFSAIIWTGFALLVATNGFRAASPSPTGPRLLRRSRCR
jgi:hypothetical protein